MFGVIRRVYARKGLKKERVDCVLSTHLQETRFWASPQQSYPVIKLRKMAMSWGSITTSPQSFLSPSSRGVVSMAACQKNGAHCSSPAKPL